MRKWMVKLKKDKDCHACERHMKKGDDALYWSCQQEDTNHLHSDHWCPRCATWAEEVNEIGEIVWCGAFLDRRLELESAPARRARTMGKETAEHVVANAAGFIECKNCGEQYRFTMPIPLTMWTSASKEFVRIHKKCKPGKPGKGG